ncbi:hypothetical protein Tco_0440184, partial [Tanacetum coccineum]
MIKETPPRSNARATMLVLNSYGGSESAQLESLSELIEGVILSNSRDHEVATRWLPHLPIKLNVFAWR